MAKICLVLSGATIAELEAQLAAHRPWISLAEVRADLVNPDQWRDLNGFSRRAGLDLILTLRQPQDGGRWQGTPAERRQFFQDSLAGKWAYWDLEAGQELPDLEIIFKAQKGQILRSFHDFQGLTTSWETTVAKIAQAGDIPKAAMAVNSSQDLHRLVQGIRGLKPFPRVVLGMGGFGMATRILAESLGSLWTYAAPEGQTLAPGQLDPKTLETLYGFSHLTPDTPVYGIIGNPVFHSKSPQVHNQGFHQLEIPGVYLPFLVDDPKTFLDTADLLNIRGLSVTIPHKETILNLVPQMSAAAKTIGACNTLWRPQVPGPWQGDNTDAPGFMGPLYEKWGPQLKDLKCTVIGTGGAARAVIQGLTSAGAQVLILGRSLEKAQNLAQEFGAQSALLDPASLPQIQAHADLLVQTTNVGMGDQGGQNPLTFYPWTGKETAYDIIYTPQDTPFLLAAQAAGCPIIYGQRMFHGQADLQFLKFTGQHHPDLHRG